MIAAGELAQRRRVAEEAAKAAGAVHQRYRGQRLARDVHEGNRADYTTEADLAAQEAVKQTIAQHFPGDVVIGEEDLDLRPRIGDHLVSGCWLTDPLDGTQEFAHGNPGCSCVVGYVKGGQSLVGAVYFAAWDELFSAAANQGATLNGAPLRVSGVTQLEQQALFATPQAPASQDRLVAFTTRMSRLAPCVEGFRMPGAQSVMVCGVAAGRYDLTAVLSQRSTLPADRPYFGQPWETGAFVVLVQEAGGVVASSSGGPPDLLNYNVYAATEDLVRQYLALMDGS